MSDPKDDPHSIEDLSPEEWEEYLAATSDPPTEKLNGSHVRVDNRPEVKMGKDLHRVLEELSSGLSRDPLVYQRGNELVTVVGLDAPDDIAPIIRSLSQASLLPRMTRHVKLVAPVQPSAKAITRAEMLGKKPEPEWREIMPPPVVTSALLACADWPEIRPLVGVTTTPLLRPDGTVLQEPGYDEQTRMLYRPRMQYVMVEDRPSSDDARFALEALREAVCDFPFARPEHEAAWLAGVLTMLARPAIPGPVPLFCVDATTRGTGKSRLVDVAVRLALGHDAARMAIPEEDDEMRKRITALVLEGDPAICLDNITRPIVLPSLDAIITSTQWKDRMLGASSSVQAPHRATWWLTGNNIVLGGDLGRRTIHVRLESNLENPEERTGFKHPELLSWVAQDRKRLLACALTILRAFFASGAPAMSASWGSFEAWSRVIPSALVWAGMTDPILARATVDPALDDEKRTLAILVDGLKRLTPVSAAVPEALAARDILAVLYPPLDPHEPRQPDGFDALRDAIEQECSTPSGRKPEARRLGKWLQRVRGRVIDGWCIERVQGPGHMACWRAVSAG